MPGAVTPVRRKAARVSRAKTPAERLAAIRARNLTGPRIVAALQLLLGCAFASLVLLSPESIRDYPAVGVFRVLTGVAILNLLIIFYMGGGDFWNPSTAYAGVFALFHFGLISIVGFGLQPMEAVSAWALRWVFLPSTLHAALLATLGLIGCTCGISVVVLAQALGIVRDRTTQRRAAQAAGTVHPAVAMVGVATLCISTAAWFTLVLSVGGPSLLLGSYGKYLEAMGPYATVMSLIWLATGLGFTLVMMLPKSLARRVGVGAFVLLALFALPLGLRGEILFPAVAALVARGRTLRPVSRKVTILALVGVLAGVATIRNLRAVGIGAASSSDEEFGGGVLEGLAELGGSLAPVVAVVQWRDRGDPFIHGASYWAPIDRALYYVTPGAVRIPAEHDDRIMNILISRRVGPIGFSPVAEAYRNFGDAGPFLVMMLVGIILALLDRRPRTAESQLAVAVVMIPLLINVRNSFVPIPAQLVMGAALLSLLLVLRRVSTASAPAGPSFRLPPPS